MANRTRGTRLGWTVLLLGLLAALGCDASALWSLLPTSPPVFPETSISTLPSFSGAMQDVGPAPIGTSLTLGSVALVVTGVVRPANGIVKRAESHPALEPGEEFVLVDVSVTCQAPGGESCNVTEFNFSLSGDSGASFHPELALSFSGLRGLFEAGSLPAGETRSGGLVFIVDQAEGELTLAYTPGLGLPVPRALFSLND